MKPYGMHLKLYSEEILNRITLFINRKDYKNGLILHLRNYKSKKEEQGNLNKNVCEQKKIPRRKY